MRNPTKLFIAAVLVCTIASICLISVVSAQSTAVNAQASSTQPQVGDTLSLTIKISDAQSLFGVDVTLDWNPSILKFVSVTPQLGVESHPGGVLHESSSYPIEIDNNDASQADGQYHLLATSTGSSTPAFSGSGNIAVLTFKVTAAGHAGLTFDNVELSTIASDGSVSLVTPSTSADSVTAVAAGSSSTPNTSVPEFTSIGTIAILIIITTSTIALSTKLSKNKGRLPAKLLKSWKNLFFEQTSLF